MEQVDILQNGNKIIQDSERFQFGIDAVLLADFAASNVRRGAKLCELGTGTGIIPLLMESRCDSAHFTALEIQQESADMARRSVKLNGLESKIEVVNADIKKVSFLFAKHSFSDVVSNPPYMNAKIGVSNLNQALAIARHEILCNLEDVVAAADYLLAPHGKFYIVHRPSRLGEIFASFACHNLEPKRMRVVYPFRDENANIVLIEARKNANPDLKVEPPLIVREPDGSYTKEIDEIYKSFTKL